MTGRTRRLRIGIYIGAALLALATGFFAFRAGTPAGSSGSSAAAELFYQLDLADAGGVARSMGEHRGKVVVVNFWATWCVPCVEEIPTFSRVHEASAGKVAFVGLGIDSANNIAGFAARFKPSYPLLVAGGGGTELARAFGNSSGALPFTVVIGRDGRVVASHLGRVDDATLRRWIAPYLESASAHGAAGTPSS